MITVIIQGKQTQIAKPSTVLTIGTQFNTTVNGETRLVTVTDINYQGTKPVYELKEVLYG